MAHLMVSATSSMPVSIDGSSNGFRHVFYARKHGADSDSNIHVEIFYKRNRFDKNRGSLDWMWARASNLTSLSGNLENVLELFEEMFDRGVSPDVVCYNIIIDGFLKRRITVNAMEISERLLRKFSAYTSVSLKIWRRMKMNGCRPDSFIYSTLIHGLFESGDVDGDLRVYPTMMEGVSVADVVICYVLLNGLCRVVYNILIRVLFENQKVDEAISIWESLPASSCIPEVNVWSFDVVASILEQGRLDEAVCIIDRMFEHGCKPNSETYNALINGCTQEMFDNGCIPTLVTYNTLIRSLCKAKRFGEVFTLVKEMLAKGFNLHNILIHGLCSVGKVEEAPQVQSEMKQRKCIPNLIWDQILEDGLQPDISYNISFEGLCSCNRISDALRLLEDALPQGLLPTKVTWHILVRTFLSSGTNSA
ncbi:hypothetical protein NE237_010659 [Protea cynaroides]|uniref:Pentatricopeptide repeat-containing protein n=1 Tax=Protea cynaroides TaxID=273540 RepID=A0A9Q0L052_9MAGN|nr:hypothetical protein NE237_010659 [Protea cynaroides]